MARKKTVLVLVLFSVLYGIYGQDGPCGGDGPQKDWISQGEFCYSIKIQDITWHNAKTECEKVNSKLASFRSKEEIEFILSMLEDHPPETFRLWIGLTAPGDDDVFFWDDGTPLFLDEWSDTAPRKELGRKRCGFMNVTDGKWGAERCTFRQQGFICMVPKPDLPTEPSVITTPVLPGYCPQGWTMHGNKCYRLFGKDNVLSWRDARDYCRAQDKMTGRLASIHNEVEQSLLTTLIDAAGVNAWIGLQRNGFWLEYAWDDGTVTDYVDWSKGAHIPSVSQLCAEMMYLFLRPGKWNVLPCTDRRPFICQMSKDPSLTTPPPPAISKCGAGFVDYKEDCYKAVTDPKEFQIVLGAETACFNLADSSKEETANLVSVLDPFEQAFLTVTFLSEEPLWIGYQEQVTNNFEWSDKWPTTYTNWASGEPNQTKSFGCAAMTYGGRWVEKECDEPLGYICKVTNKTPPDHVKLIGECPSEEWIDIQTDTCYFIRKKNGQTDWEGAKEQCQKIAETGSLASFHSVIEMMRLSVHLTDVETHLWIGLQRNEKEGIFQWVDKSPTDFFYWSPNEPNGKRGENCVEMYSHNMMWNDVSCYNSNGYVCAARKKSNVAGMCGGNGIQKDWPAKYGFCYLIDTVKKLSWYKAKEQCNQKGANLVSLRHDDDKKFLLQLVQELQSNTPRLWIGLNALGADGDFAWDDGTPVNLNEWSDNSNAEIADRKKCAYMNTEDGLWGADSCNSGSYGYVCKFPQPGWATEPPPTIAPNLPGFCPEGWTNLQNKCYKLFSSEKVTWNTAQSFCRAQNNKTGHLASVHNDMEQMVITSLVEAAKATAWIGLKRVDYYKEYLWEDDSPTDYEAWNKGMNQPRNSAICVEAMNTILRPAKWNRLPCSDERYFICQMSKDASLTTPFPPVVSKCGEDFIDYKDDCYQMSKDSKSFEEAEKTCSNLGTKAGTGKTGHLTSILDPFHQAFLGVNFASDEPVWIGYKDQQDNDYNGFKWTDSWPTSFTNWGQGQPDVNLSGLKCTAMWYGGRWTTENCGFPKRYICRITSKKPPVIEKSTGVCPSKDWVDLGTDTCYFIQKSAYVTWDRALIRCQDMTKNSSLASFHSEDEMKLFAQHLGDLQNHLWIGLRRDSKTRAFKWSDQSPTDFFHWSEGEPSPSKLEDCVELYIHNMQWNDNLCYRSNGYICAAKKTAATEVSTVIAPTVTETATVPDGVCGGDSIRRDWTAKNGFCYSYQRLGANNWHEARKKCHDLGSNLVSFRSLNEKDFVTEMVKSVVSNADVWIGLNALSVDGSFIWEDGTPLDWDDWSQGALKENVDRKKCVYLNVADGTWGVESCNKDKVGCVCKSRQPGLVTDPPPPVTPSLPGFCPTGWSLFGNKCYKVFGMDTRLSWYDAKTFCRDQNKKTGHLASAHSEIEQMFLTTLVDALGGNAWIGLMKSGFYGKYSWEDETETDFVNWNKGMHVPSNYDLCVEMMNTILRPGKWNVLSCGNRKHFICQMAKDPTLTTPEPPEHNKCGGSFVEYKDECYMKVTEPKRKWKDAERSCSTLASQESTARIAHLVSVVDPFQQAFLASTFLSTEPLWIGYSDQQDKGSVSFGWTDKWPTFFTNWDTDQPDLNGTGSCTAMSYGGRWSVQDCDEAKGYICKLTTKSPPDVIKVEGTCPSKDWIDVGTSTCYKVETEDLEDWDDASSICQGLAPKGRLISIHSAVELNLLRPHVVDSDTHIWIGLRKFSEKGSFTWSDNSPTNFLYWSDKEPSNGFQENCVELYAHDLTWNDNNCYERKGYICAADKKSDLADMCGGDGLQKDWFARDGVCYFIDTGSKLSWYKAREQCIQKGATLVSLRHNEDKEYLLHLVHEFQATTPRLWIGLNALGADGSFAWDDGTPLNLDEWSDDASEDKANRKKCAFMSTVDGLWGVDSCNTGSYGYVCKFPQPGYATVQPPTAAPDLPGYCPREWKNLGNKCYRLFGLDKRRSWNDAQDYCRSQNSKTGHLASVHSDMEQMVITSLVDAVGESAWIGIKRKGFSKEFLWEDDSPTDFTAWNKGMHVPSTSELCVEAMNQALRPGKWNLLSCSDKKYFICQMSKDASLTTPAPPAVSKCGQNFVDYKEDCYQLSKDYKSFEEAEKACSNLVPQAGSGKSAHLTSILNPFQQAFLGINFAADESLWIGYSDHVHDGSDGFEWKDAWPTTFTNWDKGQPDVNTSDSKCTSMLYGGRWTIENCNIPKRYICRMTSKIAPIIEKVDGDCPSQDWVDIGMSTCYFIQSSESVTWDRASSKCQEMTENGTLASFHSEVEMDLLAHKLSEVDRYLWIGLRKDTKQGIFQWSDQSPAEFFFWNNGEPSEGYLENCVELYSHNMKWNDESCYKGRGYICAAKKVPSSSTKPVVTTDSNIALCGGLGANWKAYDNYCYYFEKTEYFTWHAAQDECDKKDSTLLSLRNNFEGEFILSQLKNVPEDTVFWIGLTALGVDGVFAWDDGTPMTVDWWSAEALQKNINRNKCAYMGIDGFWGVDNCNTGLKGFICKARQPGFSTELSSTTVPPRIPGNCPQGWKEYGNRCYKLFGKDSPVSWEEAKRFCKNQDSSTGHLASVHSDMDQSFLTSLIGASESNAYIGLIRNYRSHSYNWEDNSKMNYDAWNKGMHVPTSANLCAEMLYKILRPGKWNLLSCDTKRPFICQMAKVKSLTTPEPDTNPNCEVGFLEYKGECYKALTDSQKPWDWARDQCLSFEHDSQNGKKSDLLSILDPFEQAFLAVTFTSRQPLWIGLADEQDQESNMFKWSDDWPITYTNWDNGQPDLNVTGKRCTAMNYGGRWTIDNCQNNHGYICKVTSKTPPPPDVDKMVGRCPSEEWKDIGTKNCYFIELSKTKNWEAASDDCQSKGDTSRLATFHSKKELEKLGPLITDSRFHMWIGLKRDTQSGTFQWVDNSPLGEFNWAEGEPSDGYREDCVELYAHDMTWNDIQCYNRKAYICVADKVPTTTTVPAITESTSCPENWKYFKRYCYFVREKMESDKDWYDSESFCNDQGSDLVSIHSSQENDFLFQLFKDENVVSPVWTGLHDFWTDKGFSWTDGSLVDFSRLNNSALEQGRCVGMDPKTRQWVPYHCGKKLGVICKRAQDDSRVTSFITASIRSPGQCQPGWFRAGNKCFLLMEANNGSWANWATARDRCRQKGYNLASIHSDYEQATVIRQLTPDLPGAWIGLHRLTGDKMAIFGWADNSKANFFNWAPRQPSSYMEGCVQMMATSTRAGKWKEEVCNEYLPYVCQQVLGAEDDPQPTSLPEANGCPDLAMTRYGSSCYQAFSSQTVDWKDAKQKCSEHGGNLASVGSVFEQAFLHTLLQEEQTNSKGFWIGLSLDSETTLFKWSDKWPVYYTNWGSNSAAKLDTNVCVFVNAASKDWSVENCNTKMGFVCKYTNDTVPEVPDVSSGVCPKAETDWIDTGLDHCFWIEDKNSTATALNRDQAEADCIQRDSHLASFHSPHELEMIKKYLVDSAFGVWIGLSKKESGGFEWSDGSPVEFEPVNLAQLATNNRRNCFELDPETMKWNDRVCTNKLGHICKISKVAQQIKDSKTDPNSGPGKGTAAAVGSVLGICVVVIAVVLVVKIRRRQPKGIFSFENVLFQGRRASDTVALDP